MRIVQFVLAAFAATFVNMAFAVPINVSASRAIEIGDATTSTSVVSTAASGIFNQSLNAALGAFPPSDPAEPVSASQNSNIQAGSGSFSGTGNASVGFSVRAEAGAYTFSRYEVLFDLTTAHAFALSGLLSANMDGGLGIGRFLIAGPTNVAFTAVGFDTQDLASSGTLAAGSYALTVFADINPGQQIGGYMGGTTSFDFDLVLRELNIPEPGALSLALIGLAGCRRRRAACCA